MQSANVPKTCITEGAVALQQAFGTRLSARAQAVLDAADTAELDADANAPAPDLSPLPSSQLCVGRRVLVARALWPAYECDENNGLGWTAHIISFSRGAAVVQFQHATDARGLPYANERLLLSCLTPL